LFESEIAFVIVKKARDIAYDIAGIKSIDGFDLEPKPRLRIRDTYYDNEQRLLEKKKIGLRVRRTNGAQLVSMKSGPHQLIRGGIRRTELEVPWSRRSVTKVAEELRIKLPRIVGRFSTQSPSKVLATMGLRVVQERLTRRQVRSIFRHSKPHGSPTAELDIDDVTFLGDPPVRIFEIEIEAKAPKSVRSTQEIAESLRANYPEFLREWPHGKLVTGLAMRRLLETGTLESYLKGGQLKAEAFSLIHQFILSS
jgi:inorganic triphosphatase YgiF